MTARRARPSLRVPPAEKRAGARQLGRHCLDPALPWRVQRTRLAQLTRPFLLPSGTTVTEQKLGGVPAEVVTVRASGPVWPRPVPGPAPGPVPRPAPGPVPRPTVVHFHGGGYCIGSARTIRGWAAHLSARAGCRVVLPEYRLAPEHPYPAGLQDARAVLAAVEGPVVLSGDSAGGGLALALVLSTRDAGTAPPAGCILLSPWLDLGRDRRADPGLARRDVLLTPDWLDACAHHRGRHPQRRSGATGGHAALAVVAGGDGMTR